MQDDSSPTVVLRCKQAIKFSLRFTMGHFRKYDQPCHYDIWVRGSIDSQWADWFDGLTILFPGEGETLLTGVIIDQSGLFGVLAVIRVLRLTLLSVQRDELAGEIEDAWAERTGSKI
jgi:hypothetical protein